MSAPRVGTRGVYRQDGVGPEIGFDVVGVEGNLCFAKYDHRPDDKPLPFIWRFVEGPNRYHDWPGK